MAEPNTSQTIALQSDVLQSLLTSVNNLQNEVSLLRQDNEATKSLLTAIQAKINTEFDSQTERGSFEVFPNLPLEIRHMIWDAALKTPRIVGARIVVQNRGRAEEALVPTASNSPILFVNKEARGRAKEMLVCFTNTLAKSRGRVPLLYLNPEVDTLWVVNYTPKRARERRITDDVVFGEKLQLRKIAIPFETWTSFTWGDASDEEESVARLMTLFHDKGIEEIVLIVGETHAAEHKDIVLVSPREIVEFYMDDEWAQEIKAIYMWPTEELLRWSGAEKYTNQILKRMRRIYMRAEQITTNTHVDAHNNIHNIVVQWAKGTWKAPVFKFKEATTRSELRKLNKSM